MDSSVSTIIGVIIILVIIFAIFAVTNYNKLVNLKNTTLDSLKQIDVQLKRRADLIPNLIETVKGYAKHESGVFEEVTKLRSQISDYLGKGGQNAATASSLDNQLTSALGKINVVVESYPDLKASQNFISLQNELTSTEDEISAARRIYNNNIRDLRNGCEQFPSNLFVGMANINLNDFNYLEFEESIKEVPKVQF